MSQIRIIQNLMIFFSMHFRHVGDLGNIEVCSDGDARVKTRDSLVQLDGQYSVIGRSIVVRRITMSSNIDLHAI